MPAKFVDTNIVIYMLSQDEVKREIALTILSCNPVMSIQVLSETANTMRRKLGFDPTTVATVINRLSGSCSYLQPLTLATLQSAIDITRRYGFSHYDSLIIAAALQTDCRVLYSEDMQHNQVIDDRLTIINPFL
ncbi:MAG: PIN domain-containing protein [Methylomonas sp.]|nr:PIN domain-containing protein [Methylomonas sp.]PPD20382.1 MAG: nucleic-acid-binding protein [Methylomonas sp.]PPD25405.1 MAG: nucleic-acid-binding protein [Methylomonas sp.]PPD35962.1 MAG: nucleic-acid-binding protein [Methylomonas sp.]PPD40533.1 MAG: nucleic-acid-binding protein [Methylomonas sp.]